MEKTIPAELLKRFTEETIKAVGLSEENAKIFSESIVAADLRGIKSHGVVRLPAYVKRVENGVMKPEATGKFIKDEAATALLDAENGFGQIAGYRAMTHAIDKARKYGIGLVAVKNSNHYGIAGFYSMMALKENMIGFALTNASSAMNPHGAVSPLLGTNPISVAIPAEKENEIVLDMATSRVSRGKIRFAAITGNEIPAGWATDAAGKPTTDAKKAEKGSLEPIGTYKGYGLSLMIDILCGILSNSCLTGEVKNILDSGAPAHTGHLFGALNIASYIPPDIFRRNIDTVIKTIKSLPLKDREIFLPGEIEFNHMAEREKGGIPLDNAVIDKLNVLADRYKLERL